MGASRGQRALCPRLPAVAVLQARSRQRVAHGTGNIWQHEGLVASGAAQSRPRCQGSTLRERAGRALRVPTGEIFPVEFLLSC